MKIGIFLTTLFFSILLVIIVRQQFIYPTKWNEIQVGMTRQEVDNLVGCCGGEIPGMTARQYVESHFILKQDMNIYFEGNRADSIRIVTMFVWETAGEDTPIAIARDEHNAHKE